MTFSQALQKQLDKQKKRQEDSKKAMEKYLQPDGTVKLTDLLKKKGS